MRSFTAEELLLAAERLRHEPLPRRAAGLLALGSGGTIDDAMALPLGERDGRLLALRAATFGRAMTAVSSCPQCGERCEIELDADAFRGETRAEVDVDGTRVRVPNSHDVLAAIASDDPRRTLLARCGVDGPPASSPAGSEASRLRDGAETAPGQPAGRRRSIDIDAIEAALEQADPRADIRLALSCPACGAAFENALDITTFFWAEIRAAAGRLAYEVHTLASAYGWREPDILAMTPWRRQLYVDLVSA